LAYRFNRSTNRSNPNRSNRPSVSFNPKSNMHQVLDAALVGKGLDKAEAELGGTVNVVVNCAGVAVAQRVLGKKGPHSLEAFLKVGIVWWCGLAACVERWLVCLFVCLHWLRGESLARRPILSYISFYFTPQVLSVNAGGTFNVIRLAAERSVSPPPLNEPRYRIATPPPRPIRPRPHPHTCNKRAHPVPIY
jgi:NAD(P)-dependent dehydrogenase (short-subunit alcohol dehydrogenase family)